MSEDEKPVCAMPLIIVMALDAAVRDGKMTVEEAVEVIRKMAGERKNDSA